MFEIPFYHKTIRNTVVAFGNIFSNIKIAREDTNGTIQQTVAVPLSYGPKDKSVVRTDSNPEMDNFVKITLPRLSFEVTSYDLDYSRKVSRLNKVTCQKSDGTMSSVFAPVPYNLGINLYLLTKNSEDTFQVVEQILPIFNPDYTVSIMALPEFNLVTDVPITLNGVQTDDGWQGAYEDKRLIETTFHFTAKTNFFSQISSHGMIKEVIMNVGDNPKANYNAIGTFPGEPIVEGWTEE